MYFGAHCIILSALVVGLPSVRCGDFRKGLKSLVRDCTIASMKDPNNEDFFDNLRGCMQSKALEGLDSLVKSDIVPVLQGVNLIKIASHCNLTTKDENR